MRYERRTQVEIAERCDLDVSSVNKILNRVKGPVFKEATIKRVFKVAEQVGYDFGRGSKGNFRFILEQLFPKDYTDNAALAKARGLKEDEVVRIKTMLYGEQ